MPRLSEEGVESCEAVEGEGGGDEGKVDSRSGSAEEGRESKAREGGGGGEEEMNDIEVLATRDDALAISASRLVPILQKLRRCELTSKRVINLKCHCSWRSNP